MLEARFYRRAALRATLAGAVAALGARAAGRRDLVGSAAAAAAVTGAALEVPALSATGVALVPLLARRRSPTVLWSTAAGMGTAVATRGLWPVAPRSAAVVGERRQRDVGPAPRGAGTVIVVNPGSGSADGVADDLRDRLPDAEVVELDDPSGLLDALEQAAARHDVRALGIVGGDGSINAAVGVASTAGKPLVVVPGGTLNHLARDLGVAGVDDAAAALEAGTVRDVDVASIDGRLFCNTASFGAYSELVDAREALEERLGKWPAMVVALARVLRHAQPCEVDLDGRRTSLWMIFVGNCRYLPEGFAPTWRERLDDGLLDVRVVDARHPWCRTRLVLAVLTGRLGRTKVYRTWTARRIEVAGDAPMRLACDGEVFDGSARFTITKAGSVGLFVPGDQADRGSTRSGSMS